MAYHLSLLDKSPILEGETTAVALQRTIALAQTARRPSIVAGTADAVRRELDTLHARFGIDTPAAATVQRLASIVLLAGGTPALAA